MSQDSKQPDMNEELTTGFAATVIRKKARQLAKQGSFTRSDIPDLEQEMKLRLWKRLHRFNPEKAPWEVFVVTVVERHAATIMEWEKRKKRRDDTPVRLLSERVPLADGEHTLLYHLLTNEDQELVRGRYADNAYRLVDLKLDLETFIARLPENLQTLCRLLMVGNLNDAARAMNIARQTAGKLLSQVRERIEFEEKCRNEPKSDDTLRANAVVKE